MSLVVKKNDGEIWRECVIRYAKPYGLEYDCLEAFDDAIASGMAEAEAAFHALYEWDCLDFMEDK